MRKPPTPTQTAVLAEMAQATRPLLEMIEAGAILKRDRVRAVRSLADRGLCTPNGEITTHGRNYLHSIQQHAVKQWTPSTLPIYQPGTNRTTYGAPNRFGTLSADGTKLYVAERRARRHPEVVAVDASTVPAHVLDHVTGATVRTNYPAPAPAPVSRPTASSPTLSAQTARPIGTAPSAVHDRTEEYAGTDAPEDFKSWLRTVDRAILRTVGVSLYDLPDTCTRDAYDSGEDPHDYAADLIASELEN